MSETKAMNDEHNHIDPAGLFPKVITGEASSDEIRKVSEWISLSEENRMEYESFATLWNLTSQPEKQEIDLDTEWKKMESVIMPAKRKTISLIRILQVAASVILISALAFFGVRSLTMDIDKAPSAGIAEYNLPDGTRVSLNADSKISYKKGFGTSHRNLKLNGEGFFEVKKGTLPFVINAGNASVMVTGTKFNLSAWPDDSELKLTVTEGAVKLYETQRQQIHSYVTAGQTGIYRSANNTISIARSVDVNDFAWKTGIMEFNNTPLSEVADILENTYHLVFNLDTLVNKCTVTVRFENQDADSVLKVLRSTLDLNIYRDGKRVSVTGPGC